MYSACDFRALLFALAVTLAAPTARAAPPAPEPGHPTPVAATDALRVCADPNNLPFSNRRGEGFENALAELVARDLRRPLRYTWWPQRRGFVRNTLNAGRCDVVMGIPAQGYDLVLPTAPYYRSTYVFVTRHGAGPPIRSFDDARLRGLRIGIHTVGDDYNNPPPAEALARRGLAANARGYSIYGDYTRDDPTRALIDAVARGDVDTAVAWGPLAGFFARQEAVALDVTPVVDDPGTRGLPMSFDIAMGVRRHDTALRGALDGVLDRRKREIARLLDRYGVPRVAAPTAHARAEKELP